MNLMKSLTPTDLLLLSLLLLIHATHCLNDVDWRDANMSPVGDQGSCGSCVGFAVAGALDWQLATVTGVQTPVSTQFMVDCGVDPDSQEPVDGCNGGVLNSQIQRLMSEQYLPYSEDYPFQGNYDKDRCVEMGAGADGSLRNALADVWVYDYTRISMTPEAVREALQIGPTIHGMYVGDKMTTWDSSLLLTDDGRTGCVQNPSPHAVTFVGWQSNGGNPYYIVRNSYGIHYGDGGYVNYADNTLNEWCRYTQQAYQLVLGQRREIEYQLGVGRKTYKAARGWCQDLGDGWDLAHVPTRMHNYQVYDMFTAKFGSDKKEDKNFNYYWIGLFDTRDGGENWVWVNGDWNVASKAITGEKAQFLNFKSNKSKDKRFAAVNKVHPGKDSIRGRWTDKPSSNEYRFVCSRYMKEVCPRISQRAVQNAHHVTFTSPGDGSETLEIVDGTLANFQCMDGYMLSGQPAECVNGQWTQLPSCD